MEFYFQCEEASHTDSHDKCREVADDIGRSPEALDLHIRNIKFVDTGSAGMPNASQSVRALVDEFRNNRGALLTEAAAIRRARGLAPLNCA